MTTPSGVVGEFKESDSAIRPMTFRRVELFNYGAELAFRGFPPCDAVPEYQDRQARDLGYRVGLEMARQRDAERARK